MDELHLCQLRTRFALASDAQRKSGAGITFRCLLREASQMERYPFLRREARLPQSVASALITGSDRSKIIAPLRLVVSEPLRGQSVSGGRTLRIFVPRPRQVLTLRCRMCSLFARRLMRAQARDKRGMMAIRTCAGADMEGDAVQLADDDHADPVRGEDSFHHRCSASACPFGTSETGAAGFWPEILYRAAVLKKSRLRSTCDTKTARPLRMIRGGPRLLFSVQLRLAADLTLPRATRCQRRFQCARQIVQPELTRHLPAHSPLATSVTAL